MLRRWAPGLRLFPSLAPVSPAFVEPASILGSYFSLRVLFFSFFPLIQQLSSNNKQWNTAIGLYSARFAPSNSTQLTEYPHLFFLYLYTAIRHQKRKRKKKCFGERRQELRRVRSPGLACGRKAPPLSVTASPRRASTPTSTSTSAKRRSPPASEPSTPPESPWPTSESRAMPLARLKCPATSTGAPRRSGRWATSRSTSRRTACRRR